MLSFRKVPGTVREDSPPFNVVLAELRSAPIFAKSTGSSLGSLFAESGEEVAGTGERCQVFGECRPSGYACAPIDAFG